MDSKATVENDISNNEFSPLIVTINSSDKALSFPAFRVACSNVGLKCFL